MRSLLALLLLVAAVPAAAQLVTEPTPDPNWTCDLYGEEGAPRAGGFYTNFWPNGVVPYAFEPGTNTVVRSVSRTDVTFRIPFDGPELQSPTGFPMNQFGIDDVIRVTGSQSNDNRNMHIVAGIALNGTTWGTLKVELEPLSTFNAESPTTASVTVFVNDAVSDPRKLLMEAGMATWEGIANINFVPRTTQPDYVLVSNSNNNTVSSNVGWGAGIRTLQMNNWGTPLTIVHELGHILGMKHEHQRPDRNTFVTINIAIVQPGRTGNFTLDNSITVYPDLTYDFGSVMHYPQNAFRVPGQTGTVITVNQPWTAQWQTQIGQATMLSFWDQKTMTFMYPENNWRFLHSATPASTKDGGFLTQWDDFDTAVAGTPTNGRLIITHPGNYVEPGVLSKAMILEAPQGGVTIKAN